MCVLQSLVERFQTGAQFSVQFSATPPNLVKLPVKKNKNKTCNRSSTVLTLSDVVNKTVPKQEGESRRRAPALPSQQSPVACRPVPGGGFTADLLTRYTPFTTGVTNYKSKAIYSLTIYFPHATHYPPNQPAGHAYRCLY